MADGGLPLSGHRDLHRLVQPAGGEHRQDRLGMDAQLGAEPPADIGADNAIRAASIRSVLAIEVWKHAVLTLDVLDAQIAALEAEFGVRASVEEGPGVDD
jgi:hypothetical protein